MTTAIPLRDKFKQITKDFLLPLFSGAGIGEFSGPPARNKEKLVTQPNKKSAAILQLRPTEDADYCLRISRSQCFTADERELMTSFLETADRLYIIENEAHQKDAALSVLTETIARFAVPDSPDFLYFLLSTLTQWSQETYEGQRIAFSVGIDAGANALTGVRFQDIVEDDFLKVLSNGQDSLLVLDKEGRIQGHEYCITQPLIPDTGSAESGGADNVEPPIYAPIRSVPFARWTKSADKRVAITLNRNGEILIFKGGHLVFAKRRGRWRYFAHEAVVKALTKGSVSKNTDIRLRQELYLTALDIAFSRTGGCIGVFTQEHRDKGIRLIDDKDNLKCSNSQSYKREALSAIINNRKFQDLDRFLRLELVSIDGATVLNFEGDILAAGAILRITERSNAGGGRQAAAESLAEHGLGIKISNDGYIRALNRKKERIVEIG